jgi:type I restriction enzyme M protein
MNLALRGIKTDLVDWTVDRPRQLFFSTQIPICLWFLPKNQNTDAKRVFRGRRQQTLYIYIDARELGTLIDRLHRDLTDHDLKEIKSVSGNFSLN